MASYHTTNKLETGYREAYSVAKKHYENFPVISKLLPLKLKKDIAIVYWFARTADDFADEGEMDQSIRIKNLDSFENRLTYLLNNETDSNLEMALKNTIFSKNLTTENFFKLIKAFKQDITKKRYSNFDEVNDLPIPQSHGGMRLVTSLGLTGPLMGIMRRPIGIPRPN